MHAALMVDPGCGFSLPLIVTPLTLMIRGNLLTRSKNSAEVVIGAVEFERDRPLGVRLLRDDRPPA